MDEVMVHSRFNLPPKVKVRFDPDDPRAISRAKQSFKEEADVNTIMLRYQRTGTLGDPGATRRPTYGDFSDGKELHEVQNKIKQAQSEFMLLNSAVRARFKNDVEELLNFISDPQNEKEAIELGLIQSQSEPESPEAVGRPPLGLDQEGAPVAPATPPPEEK